MSNDNEPSPYTKWSYMLAYPLVGILGSAWHIYGAILTMALLIIVLIIGNVRLPLASLFISGVFVNIAFLVRDLGLWGFGLALSFAAVFLIVTLFLPINRRLVLLRREK
ncbi:hypothetical protein AB1K62_09875 [Parasphingorhabdus sp. JC815]|uniref:hypothetical protein n=1 Tax=Parasphingorhabdus sp. JC815 TaxID=3232140 RepID=UPI0034597D35